MISRNQRRWADRYLPRASGSERCTACYGQGSPYGDYQLAHHRNSHRMIFEVLARLYLLIATLRSSSPSSIMLRLSQIELDKIRNGALCGSLQSPQKSLCHQVRNHRNNAPPLIKGMRVSNETLPLPLTSITANLDEHVRWLRFFGCTLISLPIARA